MKDLINTIISTNNGWIVRQILKYTALGGTALTTWLVSHGADATNAGLIATGLATAASGGLELALSKLASKVAAK